MTLTWSRRGHHICAEGTLGSYSIYPQEMPGDMGTLFQVSVVRKGKAPKDLGGSSELEGAKQMAEAYDSYRAFKLGPMSF